MDHRYKKFLTLVEAGSFSAAAKQLRVSQPAMTIAIASLERSLGKKLLLRKKHTVQLTADGDIVLRAAKAVDHEIERMHAALRTSAMKRRVHVGLIDSIAHLLFASAADKSVLENIEIMVDNSRRIMQDLADKKIDYGLITGQPAPLPSDFTIHKLHDEPFVFVASPALAPAKPVTAISNWLAFNQDSTTYRHFVRQFKKAGLQVAPTFYSTSLDLLKDMAIAGNGVALLPYHFVEDALQNKLLQVVKTEALYRPIWAISRRDETTVSGLTALTTQVETLLSHKNS